MDKMQEANIRLTMAAKALEHNTPYDLGFADLKEMTEWVLAPAKASAIITVDAGIAATMPVK